MNKIKKLMSFILLSVLTLSLLCGCDNGNTGNTSKDVSQGDSSALSDTSDNTSSESSKKDNTSAESSTKNESSFDSDYEEMMSYVNQLSPELTYEQVLEIMGEPDETFGSGINYDFYYFGKYTLRIINFNAIVEIYNSETKEFTDVY